MDYLFLRACRNELTERFPIWFMRQAGRYLPEYQAIRKHHSFVDMIHNPEIVTEITLQPIKRYKFDAAILYSDILTVSEFYNIHFEFIEKKGPVLVESDLSFSELTDHFSQPIKQDALTVVYDAIKLLKNELTSYNIPLIGFSGSPFTVACYLIEKGSSKDFSNVLSVIKNNPKGFQTILDSLTQATIFHLKKQILAGVNAIQIFDTWGSILTGKNYLDFTYSSLKTIVDALSSYNIPILLYSKNSTQLIHHLAKLNINVLSVDWNSSLNQLKTQYPNLSLQGNLNPHTLLDNKELSLQQTRNICKTMSQNPGFIFNLGHGILPKTPLDHVESVVNYVKNFQINRVN